MSEVTDIRCRVRSSLFQEYTVFERIHWGDVTVAYTSVGDYYEMELPLVKDFMLGYATLTSGNIPASNSGLWQLQSQIDGSLAVVFGYEVRGGALTPISPSVIGPENENFMPVPGELRQAIPRSQGHGEGRVRVTLNTPGLRVVVCIELVCCKENHDFEPLGVLGAGRVYPHLMLVANRPLNRMTASIELYRPEQSDHSRHHSQHMSQSITPGFFTDANTLRLPFFPDPAAHLTIPVPVPWDPTLSVRIADIPPPPIWDSIFDYYNVDPSPNARYTVVDATKSGTRHVSDGARYLNYPSALLTQRLNVNPLWPSALIPRPHWDAEDVVKLPRQGAYDNVHIAPKMLLPILADDGRPTGEIVEVTMAPICAHDCLHLHWRWGGAWDLVSDSIIDKKPLAGWELGFSPYARVGAPMVPHNQTVFIERIRGAAIRYTVRIESDIEPGRWQIVMHHGGAYALSLDRWAGIEFWEPLGQISRYLSANMDQIPHDVWAQIYYYLRYQPLHEDFGPTPRALDNAERIQTVNRARLENG